MRIDCISGDIRGQGGHGGGEPVRGAKRPAGGRRGRCSDRGAIAAAVRAGDFAGKLGETLSLRPSRGLSPEGPGGRPRKKEKFTADHARQAVLPVLKAAKRMKLSTVASVVHGAGAAGRSGTAARFCSLGAALSASSTTGTRRRRRTGSSVSFCRAGREGVPAVRAEVSWAHGRRGDQLGPRLVATPPAELRPADLARAARGVGRGIGAAAARKCGSASSVSRSFPPEAGGSSPWRREPRAAALVVAEYRGGSPGSPWTALVGKGVTFDTGGISLKKWEGMEKMKYDMAGVRGCWPPFGLPPPRIRRNLVAVVPAWRTCLRDRIPARRRPSDDVGKTVESCRPTPRRLILATR